MKTLFATSLFSFNMILPAYAHFGHLGEIAGHAHWLGLGAGLAAGAIAATLAKKKAKEAEQKDEDEVCEPAEGEAENLKQAFACNKG